MEPEGEPEPQITELQTRKKSAEEDSEELSVQRVLKQIQEKHSIPTKTSRLHVAVKKGHFSKVKRCLIAGDEVDAVDETGWSPLLHAVTNGQRKTVNVLLKADADTSLSTPKGFSPLHLATEHGNAAIIKSLIKADADIDAGNGELSETALMVAASKGDVGTARILLDEGADISKRSAKGATALSFAACQGSDDVLLMLIDQGADVDDLGYKGHSSLAYAASYRHPQTVAHLIERGANVNLECTDGRTVLDHASELGFDDIVAVLLRSGADVNHKVPISGKTPLHGACSNGHHKCARLLIEAGADVLASDNRGFTSLHRAVEKPMAGYVEVMELLLSAGANLLSEGATINDAPQVLITAVDHGSIAQVQLLLEAGCDPNVLDKNGRPALFFAKTLDVVKLLLAKGADAKVIDNFGFTLLYAAGFRGSSTAIVCALYNAGANPCRMSKKGQIASDIAREKGFKDTAILLDMLIDKYRKTYGCEEGKQLGPAKAIEQQSCEPAPKATITQPKTKLLSVESSMQDKKAIEPLDVSERKQDIEAAREPAPCLNCDAITIRLCSWCGGAYFCCETCEMFARHVCCG